MKTWVVQSLTCNPLSLLTLQGLNNLLPKEKPDNIKVENWNVAVSVSSQVKMDYLSLACSASANSEDHGHGGSWWLKLARKCWNLLHWTPWMPGVIAAAVGSCRTESEVKRGSHHTVKMKPWGCCGHMQEVKLPDMHENAQMDPALWKNTVELLSASLLQKTVRLVTRMDNCWWKENEDS